MVIDYKVNII